MCRRSDGFSNSSVFAFKRRPTAIPEQDVLKAILFSLFGEPQVTAGEMLPFGSELGSLFRIRLRFQLSSDGSILFSR